MTKEDIINVKKNFSGEKGTNLIVHLAESVEMLTIIAERATGWHSRDCNISLGKAKPSSQSEGCNCRCLDAVNVIKKIYGKNNV